MSTLVHDLLSAFRRAGLEAQVNDGTRTIDIVRVDGRPLLDPWPIHFDEGELQAVVQGLRHLLGSTRSTASRADALEHISWSIRSDVTTYAPAHGPFRLDRHGGAVPTRPLPFQDWED